MIQTTLPIPLETKASPKGEIAGYGSTFGNVDHGGDIVLPGAFAKSLQEYKDSNTMPSMFWMHKADQVPGIWNSAVEDQYGLQMKGAFADTALGNDTRTLTSMKAVGGLSIGYITQDYKYDNEGNRLLKQVDLIEVSVVSLAMNPKAQITHAKSRLSERGEYVPDGDEIISLKTEIEQFLRIKGWSRRAARAGIHAFFKGLTDGMSDDPPQSEELR